MNVEPPRFELDTLGFDVECKSIDVGAFSLDPEPQSRNVDAFTDNVYTLGEELGTIN